MVVGLDVHHASPGSSGASFAAVVASLDMQCVTFRTVVTTQEMVDVRTADGKTVRKQRQEIVHTLYDTMTELLKEFCRANCFKTGGRPPRRIVFFRDGVAHNQFEAVAEQEIEQVTRACMDFNGGTPIQLVFIVTQMRTKTRLATEGGGGGGKGGGKGGRADAGALADELSVRNGDEAAALAGWMGRARRRLNGVRRVRRRLRSRLSRQRAVLCSSRTSRRPRSCARSAAHCEVSYRPQRSPSRWPP